MSPLNLCLLALGLLVTSVAVGQAPDPKRWGIEKRGPAWWFVSPEGKPLWSLGVCCVNPGASWDQYDPTNPGYAAHRLFDTPGLWADWTNASLRAWGFNTLGGWSDHELLRQVAKDRLPYFEVLHLGAYWRAPWDDLYTAEAESAFRVAARDQIAKLKDDPLLIGYFSDNELGWWPDSLFLHYFAFGPEAPGKRELVRVLKAHYGNFDRLKRDFAVEATDWDSLRSATKIRLRPGGSGMAAIHSWLESIASHYYRLMHRLIRKHDPDRLILGDRYIQFYWASVVRASAPWIDAVSTNLGATFLDGTFPPFFLETLHQLTGKPVVVTEFYMGATDNRSGNLNVPPAFPVVATQSERAAAFQRNIEELADLPYVIGAHWFQYWDQPPRGRGDGENFNHGLVDTRGVPYQEMVDAARRAMPEQRHYAITTQAQRAAILPWVGDAAMTGLAAWDRTRAIVPGRPTRFGDLYASWDDDGVYVGLIVHDYLDERLYEGDRIPEEERARAIVEVDGVRAEVRFGGKDRPATLDGTGVEIIERPSLRHELVLKFARKVAPGATVKLDVRVDSHSRAETMAWQTELEAVR